MSKIDEVRADMVKAMKAGEKEKKRHLIPSACSTEKIKPLTNVLT